MKRYIISVIAGICFPVFAEVNVVQDSKKDGEYLAKVLSKEVVFNDEIRLISRRQCDRIVQRTHIDRWDRTITVMPSEIKCRIVYEDQKIHVLNGFFVTYEYRGKIMSAKLNYDPGEFIKIHSDR